MFEVIEIYFETTTNWANQFMKHFRKKYYTVFQWPYLFQVE